ncbi:hypothetical protein AKJ16_DCAP10483 [Drosera capensis]
MENSDLSPYQSAPRRSTIPPLVPQHAATSSPVTSPVGFRRTYYWFRLDFDGCPTCRTYDLFRSESDWTYYLLRSDSEEFTTCSGRIPTNKPLASVRFR